MCLMSKAPYEKLLIFMGTGFTKLKPKSTQILTKGKIKEVSILVFVVSLGNIYSWSWLASG